jgi:plasmid stability protein
MGAWLHDCGKITTPEFVVDKATKLETLYNRIHEVRMRFEVLWRDLEITYLRRLMEGEERETLQAWLESERRRLQEDFAFVAECNLGSEAMDPARKARLKEIARRTWMRHFDDRLGLSDVELRRYAESPPRPLPVEEPLLADRPEHIEERTGFDEEAYRKKGFKLEVPRHLYNRGELYNLGVERGTLTPEERFKIEEHVIMTIEMLEQLPYPEGMERIPEYAGTHHETLDGTGYPRRLDASSLSIPARIMAIADIFEALTASDRPYKKSKTLSESLRIMAKMVAEGRLDAELFTLFIRRKIYLRYARAHLGPGQIDEVDEEKILQLATKETR